MSRKDSRDLPNGEGGEEHFSETKIWTKLKLVAKQKIGMTEEFRAVTNAIITHRGKILLGKKEEKEGHPISGEWHFPGGHIEKGEEPEDAVVREIKEETGLDVEIHQLVDATTQTWNDDEVFQTTYHCEAEGKNAEAENDLEEVKWVQAEDIKSEIGDFSQKNIEEREEIGKFLERIQKAPY